MHTIFWGFYKRGGKRLFEYLAICDVREQETMGRTLEGSVTQELLDMMRVVEVHTPMLDLRAL